MNTPNFSPFPLLSTTQFILRQLASSDADAIFRLRTDDEVNRYIHRQRATSVQEVYGFIDMINENITKGLSILWAISKKDEPGLVGTICLWKIDAALSTAELGYELLPEYHGKQIMQEVIPVVIEYAFGTLGVHAISAELNSGNLRSIRLLEKNGFLLQKEIEPGWVEYRLQHSHPSNPGR